MTRIPNHTRRLAGVVAALTLGAAAAGCSDDSPDAESSDESPETSASSESSDDPTATSAIDDSIGDAATSSDVTLTLVTYESFPTDGTPINDRLDDFTAETGIDVEILVAGDTGTMLSKAELTAGNPEGDVMWGIDNTFLSRAISGDVFEPYVASGIDGIPDEFTRLVPNGEATPVDFGDVCVNYDIGALEALGVDPPAGLADLTEPAYADLLVVQNPATSSPGLAFLLATIDEYGDDGWQEYWDALTDNGVAVVDGWTSAYYEQFSYYGGDRPLVVSYGSSPPFEVLFAEEPRDEAPTGVIESTCFRQIEFAGVLTGTAQPDAAGRLVDFLISEPFQAELPLNVFVFPANPSVELDPVFVDNAVIPETSRSLDPAAIAENRADWIDEWTDLVLG